ncbi:hypothetical protein [Brackiella oedipodis]|uniref:hypothetical protein n=1 Tax=Brackiella oedipodis TaxID=124225 RepID=UPI0006876002|nr:hypothetical protein [Brackiella oedipodis]
MTISEFDFVGLYLPLFLVELLLAYLVFRLFNYLIVDKLVVRGWIAYPSIFYLFWYFTCLVIVHKLHMLLNTLFL